MNLSSHIRTFLPFIFLFYTILVSDFALAQESYIYATKQGNLSLAGLVEHIPVNAHSKRLEVSLDYDKAIFEMKLPISSLHTGIDTLDQVLRLKGVEYFTMNGQLGIEFINTQYHPPQHFEFQGTLEYMLNRIDIVGTGHLQHIEGGDTYSCLLGLSFEFNPQDFGFEIMDNEVKVTIRQTVLKRVR
jgi:hypothetical protein